MAKAPAASLLVLGCTSLVAQVLLIRELLSVFHGNEFFIGWTLFAWLFWTAAGALAAGRWPAAPARAARTAAAGHWGAGVLLPAGLLLARAGRTLAGAAPGAAPDLLPALALSFCAVAPLCLVLGAQFVFSLRAWSAAAGGRGARQRAGPAYACETAGFVVGGLAFSFALVTRNEFHVAGMLGLLHAAAGAALAAGAGRPGAARMAGGATALFSLAILAAGGWLQAATERWRFPGQELVESRHSIHGQLAVTRLGRQVNFFENGLLLGGQDEPLSAEPLAHYPLLWHPDPRRVLLAGAGFNGILAEILKHAPARVDALELDPAWLDLAQRQASPAQRAALDDPRVHWRFGDVRRQLHAGRAAATAYDVAILNLPGPGTLLVNRGYSLEFFRDLRARLAPGGVLAVRLDFSPDYLGPELADLTASIYWTLRAVFPQVSILPGYEILYLATDGSQPPPEAETVLARYASRGLRTEFVIPPAIAERLASDRIPRTLAVFAARRNVPLNRDERPIACFFQFRYWLRAFHPRAAEIAGRAGRLGWPWAAGAAGIAGAVMAGSVRGRRSYRLGAWAMGIGSFSLMACELAILFAFQVFCGYLYHKLALMLAALMLGMAAGAALGGKFRIRPAMLGGLHAGMAVFAAGLAWALEVLAAHGRWAVLGAEAFFLLAATLIGALAGAEFPVANRIYSGAADSARGAGVVYGVDLLGSCLAALGIGLWALPVLGMQPTLAVLAGLNAITGLICLRVQTGPAGASQ